MFQESSMQSFSRAHRTPLATAALAMAGCVALTACGGGGDAADSGNTPARITRATASLGNFVPEGQAQLVVNLSACARSPDGGITNQEAVNNAALTFTAEGDIVLRGAVGSGSTTTDLYRINASETNLEREIEYYALNNPNGSGLQASYTLTLNDDTRYVTASAHPNTTGSIEMENADHVYSCTLPAGAFSFPDNVLGSRLAVLTDGTTRTDPIYLRDSAALTQGTRQITWDNALGAASDPLSSASQRYADSRFLRLDWSGATAVASGSSSLNGSYSVLSSPLQGANASAYEGYFSERSFPNPGGTVYELRALLTWGQGVPGVSYDLRMARFGTDLYPYANMTTAPAVAPVAPAAPVGPAASF
jgi:hypothetical protein